ncbi:MAG: trigger factor [Blautia sp.]|nr:trigger factor [Blautia sp.]MBR2561852.1 trigger factor [Eubacterium sp.]
MSLQIETLEKNMAKLTIEVAVEDLEKAMQNVYMKMKSRINVPGFRKGKAPRKMIERVYGAEIFLEDAVNQVINEKYYEELKDSDLEVVSSPKIDVVQAEVGKPVIFTAEVATKPEITLGQYRGIEVPRQDLTVTDAEIDARIRSEQEKNSRMVTVTERSAIDGDTLTLDYKGTIDGVAFDGGTAENATLVLGSNSFIPGFEQQLIGTSAGSSVEVKVTFPENYHAKELAGKDAVFACDVKKIEVKELPELDDEFAQDVSDFNTFEEYRQSVREELEKQKADRAKENRREAALGKAIENAQMDIPEAMIQTQVQSQYDDFAQSARRQGIQPEEYLSYMGQTPRSYMEQMRPRVTNGIQARLVLEKIAETEQIEPTEEELKAEIEKAAASSGLKVEDLEKMEGIVDQIKEDFRINKALEILGETSVEVDVQPEAAAE